MSPDPWGAFRHAPYRWFTLSRLASVMASQMGALAVGWQVYELTGSAFDLGLVGLVQIAPVFAFTLWGGQLADRLRRRDILLATQSLHALCALALAAVSARPSLPALFAVLFLGGVGRAFQGPAGQALMPSLVPRELLGNALSWRAVVFESSSVLGPALGGVLLARSARQAFLVDAALCALSVLALLKVPRLPRAEPDGGEDRGLLSGMRFVRSRPLILGAMSLDLLAVLFGGATALLPLFAKDILHVGPQGLGLLRAAPSCGAILVSLWLMRRPAIERAGRALLASVAAYGGAMALFGLSGDFLLSVGLLALSGVADGVSVLIRHTIVQTLTPDGMRGRVSAVNGIFFQASNELGEFESGVAASLMGAAPSVVAGGLVTVGVTALFAWRLPGMRRLGRLA